MATVKHAAKEHTPTYTDEGGGVVVTCSCGWLRYALTEGKAKTHHRDHLPRPPKVAA
ncbi:MAG: hypothetical protein L0H93_20410 [Nocardioides sp.]|nr:hypothetical protein [Nocardioides sp.]